MTTWVLVIVVIFGASRNHGAVNIIPGYDDFAFCNKATQEAIDNSDTMIKALVSKGVAPHVVAFCVPGPRTP